MFNRLKKFSFFNRLLWMIWLFILLPISLTAYVSFELVSKEVTERIEKANREVVDVVQDRVSRMIEDITFSANVLIQDPGFVRQAEFISKMEALTTFEEHMAIQSIMNTISFVETKTIRLGAELFYMNEADMVLTNRNAASIKPNWPTIKSYLDKNNVQTMQWIRTYNQPGDKNVYGIRLLQSQNGARIGAIVIVLPYSFFEKMAEIHEYGVLSISDREGRLLWYSSKNGMDYEQAVSLQEGEYLHTAKPVDFINWSVDYRIDEWEVTGSITKLFYTFIWIIAGFVILFLVLAVWMATRLYKPLRKLQQTATVFSSGDLKVRYDSNGKDEIAFLGHAFNRMLDQTEKLIQNIEQEQEEKKVIELTALSGQIRPHFLMNTLNAFKCSLALTKDAYHSGKIDSLMSLLRAYMRVHVPSTLAKEAKLLTDYVDIMNMRNIQNVKLHCELEDGPEHVSMPALFMQPIVENSIVHGLLQKEGEAWIRIKAWREDEMLVLTIEDNGAGMDPDKLAAIQTMLELEDTSELPQEQVGLLNVKKRMKLTYGKEASLSVHSRQESQSGTQFEFKLPISRLSF